MDKQFSSSIIFFFYLDCLLSLIKIILLVNFLSIDQESLVEIIMRILKLSQIA